MQIPGLILLPRILLTMFLCVRAQKLNDSTLCNFPAIYNFGDSNSDTGGISAAFYPMASPCGVTFFHKPAGRASDGRLVIDFIAEHLGLPYLSAYLDSIGTNFRHGENFATGGSTIVRPTNESYASGVSPFSLEIQIEHFNQFKERTTNLYKQEKKSARIRYLPKPKDFSKALYTFDIGQNDLAAGFGKMSYEQLRASIPNIINHLAAAIQNLYQQGAMTFWIHNTGPIGCLAVTQYSLRDPMPGYLDKNGCVKDQNDMAMEFNRQLKDRVMKLREELPDAALTYVDVYAAKYKLISTAKHEGFTDQSKICCGYQDESNYVWCGEKMKIKNGSEVYGGSCANPSMFISWDGVHYTEAATRWPAKHIINDAFSEPAIPISRSCHKH